MRGPWALATAVATFAASWRNSNCTVRAGDHRNKGAMKIKIVEIRRRVFMGFILPAAMASDSASHDEDITPSDVPTDPPTVMQGPMT